jgi:Flp pilus assembly secretin CpaC
VRTHVRALALGILLVAGAPLPSFSQQRAPAAPAAPPAERVLTSLKVQVVLARYRGDKRISSVPFTMAVTANERPSVVQSGTQVLIPMVTTEGKTVGPVYKDVGTRIECSATVVDSTHYKLDLQVEDSTLAAEDQATSSALTSAPFRIRTFRSNQIVMLGPGESFQYTTAEDRQSGEEVRVSVSMASMSITIAK